MSSLAVVKAVNLESARVGLSLRGVSVKLGPEAKAGQRKNAAECSI